MAEMIDLRKMYDDVLDLQQDLRCRVGAMALADFTNPCVKGPLYDYRLVKALAATYELQEFLANEIARAVEAGELDPDPED